MKKYYLEIEIAVLLIAMFFALYVSPQYINP